MKSLKRGLDEPLAGADVQKIIYLKGQADYEIIPASSQGVRAENSHRVRMAKSFDGLNTLTRFGAKNIEQIIALLIMRGVINPDNLGGKIIDFGTGTGPGAYVFKQYGGNVTGVDISEGSVKMAVEEGILPKEKAVVRDGFEYLSSLQQASLDFIGAFMMQRGFSHERLYQESQRVLKPNGQLLIHGGLMELEDELQRTVGGYGKIEDLITVYEDSILENVAFVYTHNVWGFEKSPPLVSLSNLRRIG